MKHSNIKLQTCRWDKVSIESVPSDPVSGYDHDDNDRHYQRSKPENSDTKSIVTPPNFPETNQRNFNHKMQIR